MRRWLGKETGIVATPHSQRSRAEVRVRLAEDTEQCVDRSRSYGRLISLDARRMTSGA